MIFDSAVTMTFEPGVKSLLTTLVIQQDNEPEDTESFYVRLSNPSPGADIGNDNTLTVNILSNDNAHGIIEVAPVSKHSMWQPK